MITISDSCGSLYRQIPPPQCFYQREDEEEIRTLLEKHDVAVHGSGICMSVIASDYPIGIFIRALYTVVLRLLDLAEFYGFSHGAMSTNNVIFGSESLIFYDLDICTYKASTKKYGWIADIHAILLESACIGSAQVTEFCKSLLREVFVLELTTSDNEEIFTIDIRKQVDVMSLVKPISSYAVEKACSIGDFRKWFEKRMELLQ